MANKSSALRILEVACRSKDMRASVYRHATAIIDDLYQGRPASFTINLTFLLPASTEFSINS